MKQYLIFNITSSEQFIKRLVNFGEVLTTEGKKTITKSGFQRSLLRGRSTNNGHGILNVNNLTVMLQKHIELCAKKNMVFCSERNDEFSTVIVQSMTEK